MLMETAYIKQSFSIIDEENNSSQFNRIIKLIIY